MRKKTRGGRRRGGRYIMMENTKRKRLSEKGVKGRDWRKIN